MDRFFEKNLQPIESKKVFYKRLETDNIMVEISECFKKSVRSQEEIQAALAEIKKHQSELRDGLSPCGQVDCSKSNLSVCRLKLLINLYQMAIDIIERPVVHAASDTSMSQSTEGALAPVANPALPPVIVPQSRLARFEKFERFIKYVGAPIGYACAVYSTTQLIGGYPIRFSPKIEIASVVIGGLTIGASIVLGTYYGFNYLKRRFWS